MAKGFIYVMSNPAMPGLLKVGVSVKIPEERAAELYTTGVPAPFSLDYYCIVNDAIEAEAEVHELLSQYRIRDDREFFEVTLDDVIKAVRAIRIADHEWLGERAKVSTPSADGSHWCKNCDIRFWRDRCPRCFTKPE